MSYFGQAEAPNTSQRSSAETSYPIVRTYRDEAACKGADHRIFYPGLGESQAEAKEYCDRCAVVSECLVAGWVEGDWFSFRAGMSVAARRKWAKGRRHALRCEVCRMSFIGKRGQATCGSVACLDEMAVRRNRRSSAEHRRNGA